MSRRLLMIGLAFVIASAASISHAQSTLYWSGNGTTLGGAGTWDTLLTRWGTVPGGPFSGVWDNADLDTAVFGGSAAGTVTIGAPITVGGLQFNITGYTIAAGTQGLTFGATNNAIVSDANGNPGNVAATISGTVGGTGNVTFMSRTKGTANSVTFNGTSSGGWSGATTINAGMTLVLGTTTAGDAVNRALLNTSAVAINGGGLTLNFASGFNSNRISDSAAIGVTGGGTFTIGTSNNTLNESVGPLTLNSGQFNLTYVNNPSSGGTMTFSSFTRSGSTSALTVSSATNGFWRFTGQPDTAANEIVGPWATTGAQSGTSAQTDYAIFTGGTGQFASRSIAASAESTWSTTQSAVSNFTMSAIDSGTISGGGRNVNTLRSLNNSVTVTASNPNITLTGHTLAVDDVVTFSATTIPTGLTAGTPYYVVATGANTIQVSATKGGTAITPTTAGSAVFAAGAVKVSSGNNFGSFGILNGSATTLNILRDGGGSVTLPTTSAGNLFVTTGAGAVAISAPITDNTGALTLVKSGTGGSLTLSGTNTYTGGSVINAGTLQYTADAALGASGSRNVTFGGTGSLTWGFDGSSLGTLTVNAGAVGTLGSANNITFTTTTGSGTIRVGGGQNKSQNLGNASTFTGDVVLAYNSNNNSGANAPHLQFSSLNDAVGSALQIYRIGSGTDSGQIGQIGLSGNTGNVTFDNRQVQLLPRASGSGQSMASNYLLNNNATAANKWVINTNLLNLYDRNVTLGFGGTNGGDNAFNGLIGDSAFAGVYSSGTGVLAVTKTESGKWILGNTANTYTGATTVSAGTLEIKSLADGGSASSIGASSSAAGNLVLGNGVTLLYTGTGHSSNRSFTINGTSAGHQATIESSGAGAISFTNTATPGYGTTNQTRTFNVGGTNTGANTLAATLANNGTGAVSLDKEGAGRWILTGTNTYTGATTINGGVLQAADGTGIPTASILQLRGGVFQSSGTFNRTVGTAAGNVNWSTSSGGFAAIGGALNLQLNGGTSSVTWNGASMVQTGQTLVFGSTTADSLVDFQNALNLGSSGSGQRTIQVVDNALSANDFARISGNITNTVAGWGILKTGNGTLELTGTNSYTGNTTVNEGILLINGNNSAATGAISVAAGAYLGGTGTIGANLTFAATSLFEIADINDPLAATGTVTFGSGFGIANLSGVDWDALDLNTAYTLISTSQTFTSGDIANFGLANAAPVGTGRSAYFQNGSLQLVVVPEPAALALLGCGAALVGMTLYRRRRS